MYRKQKKYPSCQLIAAINARIFLGMGDISDDLYETLVDLAKCRSGAAITVDKTYSILGLEHEDGEITLDWVKSHLPVQISLFTKHQGFHAILIVDVKKDVLQVVNLKYTKRIKWSTLEKMFPPEHVRTCRSFKICQKCPVPEVPDHEEEVDFASLHPILVR